jgi:Fatty acid hydroxylase
VPSLFFLLFDSVIPSLSVEFKRQGVDGLPTRGARRGGSRPQWYQVIGISLLNILLSVAIQAGVEVLFTEVFHIRSALKVTTTLPMPWSIAKDVIRGLLLREVYSLIQVGTLYSLFQVIQYYLHRFLLHENSNILSRLHNSWFHSLTAPYSFVAHYDHPASYIFFRFLPTYLPSIIFRVHLLTYLLLLAIITFEETLTLSGYSSVPGIMLGGIARRQDRKKLCSRLLSSLFSSRKSTY